MSMKITVKYDDVYKALEPLRGIKLRGSVQGAPISRFPLRDLIEYGLKDKIVGIEEYRDVRVVGVGIRDSLYLICNFGLEQPDDFCVAVEASNAWERICNSAIGLSKLTGESYTLMLSAIVHALQGIVSAEEEEVEEISDPDQVIEELLTWLPEYIAITD